MRTFWNYTRQDSRTLADSDVHAPTSVDSLKSLLRTQGKTYTLRSAGQALAGQALPPTANTGVILFSGLRATMTGPTFLASDPEGERAAWTGQARATITAEGWATWGEVFDELQKKNCLSYNSVTARRISVAGSINASALSQRSPIWGKEEHSIVWIRYYNAQRDAVVRVYHPDSWAKRSAAGTDTLATTPEENKALFCAVVGGLGVLGPILSAKFLVLELPTGTNPLRVHTRVARYTDLYRFAQALVKVSTEARAAAAATGLPRTYDPNAFRTFHAVARLGQGTEVGEDIWGTTFRAAIFTQSFKRDREAERPFLLWDRPKITNTYKTYLAANFSSSTMELEADREMARMLYNTAYWSNADHQPYTNDLCPATFFLEAHADARDSFETKRIVMECWQQTFSLPVSPMGNVTADVVIAVLLQARKLAKFYSIRATATDLIFLPASMATLAPNRDMDSIAITFGFEWVSRDGRESRVMSFCQDMSAFVAQRGGKVHLGKAVSANSDALKKMYGAALADFEAVRANHVGPATLTSDLWEKLAAATAQTVAQLPDAPVPAYPLRPDLAPDSGWNPLNSLKPATDRYFDEGPLSLKPLEPCGPWETTGTTPPPDPSLGKVPSDLQTTVSGC